MASALEELARTSSQRPDGPAVRALAQYLRESADRGVRSALVQHARSRHALGELREDLVQQALVRLVEDDFRLIRDWDPARSSLRGWVGLLARQRSLNAVAKQRRTQWSERPASDRLAELGVQGPPVGSGIEGREFLEAIRQRVYDRATPGLRQTLELWFFQDHSVTEISQITGRTVGAVYRAVHSLRALARTARDELLAEGPHDTP